MRSVALIIALPPRRTEARGAIRATCVPGDGEARGDGVESDRMVGSSNHLVGPHHLVLLVLEDVAVNGISK